MKTETEPMTQRAKMLLSSTNQSLNPTQIYSCKKLKSLVKTRKKKKKALTYLFFTKFIQHFAHDPTISPLIQVNFLTSLDAQTGKENRGSIQIWQRIRKSRPTANQWALYFEGTPWYVDLQQVLYRSLRPNFFNSKNDKYDKNNKNDKNKNDKNKNDTNNKNDKNNTMRTKTRQDSNGWQWELALASPNAAPQNLPSFLLDKPQILPSQNQFSTLLTSCNNGKRIKLLSFV